MKASLILVLAAGVVLPLMCVGCAEKFTPARYQAIRVGMPQDEVEATLGEPTARFTDTWSYLHDDPFYKAVIKFDDSGKVSDKAWYDSRTMETHPDAKPQK